MPTLTRPACEQNQSQKHAPNPGQGAVSVLANAFIASMALGEPLRWRDLLGCLLCAGGGVVIVVSPYPYPTPNPNPALRRGGGVIVVSTPANA